VATARILAPVGSDSPARRQPEHSVCAVAGEGAADHGVRAAQVDERGSSARAAGQRRVQLGHQADRRQRIRGRHRRGHHRARPASEERGCQPEDLPPSRRCVGAGVAGRQDDDAPEPAPAARGRTRTWDRRRVATTRTSGSHSRTARGRRGGRRRHRASPPPRPPPSRPGRRGSGRARSTRRPARPPRRRAAHRAPRRR